MILTLAAGLAGAAMLQSADMAPPPAEAEAPPVFEEPAPVESDRMLTGFVELEGRWFPRESDDGVDRRFYGSVAVEPSLRWDSDDGRHSLRFTGFGRVDTVLDHRTHADVREAKWVGDFGNVQAVIGVDRVFWGVTEAAHIVNIINQIDELEDIDQEDLLGQPLASLSLRTDLGSITGYVLPWFRERRFPGGDDRPNARFAGTVAGLTGPLQVVLPIDRSETRFESRRGNDHVDWAVRWQSNLGPLDLGLHYFSGTDRDPTFRQVLNHAGQPVIAPFYELIDQVGLDTQLSLGSLALKFEGIRRWADLGDYGAIVAGFEYTFGGAGPGGSDIGLLAEYLWNDGKGRGPSPFEDDVMLGIRWSGNDERSTELLAAAVLDAKGDGMALNIEGSRRLSENVRVAVDARLFTNERSDSWDMLRDDGFVQLKLQWFF